MKTKYATKTKCGETLDGYWLEDKPLFGSIFTHEYDNEPRYTGILDKNGHELIAFELPEKLGFLDFDE